MIGIKQAEGQNCRLRRY